MVTDRNRIPETIASLLWARGELAEEVAKEIHERADESFETGTDATGKPWEPLHPMTIRQTGPQILVDTGDMRESGGYEADRASGTATAGFEDNKILFHEYGIPEQNLPARPVLGPAAQSVEQDLDEITETTIEIALGGLRL